MDIKWEWEIKIQCFLMDYPEFIPYAHHVPISPILPIPYTNVNTLFQAIMHYICAAGVRYSYAVAQWDILYPLINCENWSDIVENMRNLETTHPQIQKKKRGMYNSVCLCMNAHSMTHTTINVSHMSILREEVCGIGDGCVAWMKRYFTLDDDCIEYTDIIFKRGFKHIYGDDSVKLRKATMRAWLASGYGRIANYMVMLAS